MYIYAARVIRFGRINNAIPLAVGKWRQLNGITTANVIAVIAALVIGILHCRGRRTIKCIQVYI